MSEPLERDQLEGCAAAPFFTVFTPAYNRAHPDAMAKSLFRRVPKRFHSLSRRSLERHPHRHRRSAAGEAAWRQLSNDRIPASEAALT